MTSPNGPGGATRRPLPSSWAKAADDAVRREHEERQARVDKAQQGGWVIWYDAERLAYCGAREMVTGRSVDAVLSQIEELP